MILKINEIQYPSTKIEIVQQPNDKTLIISIFRTTDDLLNIRDQFINILWNDMAVISNFYVDFTYKDEIDNKIVLIGEEKIYDFNENNYSEWE